MAEHGREHAADPQKAGVGGSTPRGHRPDPRLVRVRGPALERGPAAVRVGREASRSSAAPAGASPPGRRLGGMHACPPSPGRETHLWPQASQMTH